MHSSIQRLLTLASIALLLGALACAPPERTDYSPDDEVDDSGGSNLPPSGDDDDDDIPVGPSDDDDDVINDDDDDTNPDCEPLSATTDPEGFVIDCFGDCGPASWLGDADCDERFNCSDLIFDFGDCPQ